MFFIPAWITQIMFLGTFYVGTAQLLKSQGGRTFLTLQFPMMVFALVMILVVWFYNATSPVLSMAFFAAAVICLLVLYRQRRLMPPLKLFG